MGSDLSQPTSTSLTLDRIFLKYTLHRKLPLASFLLLKSFYELCCVFRLLTVNLRQSCRPTTGRGSTCTSVIFTSPFTQRYYKLARQPYVLDCFALMFCSSNACLSLSDPPTLTLMIPL